jgi:hypothetical protein
LGAEGEMKSDPAYTEAKDDFTAEALARARREMEE